MPPKPYQPEVGTVFGRLTVIGGLRLQNPANPKSGYQTLCKCSCGSKKRWVQISRLKSGASKSCGCLAKEKHTQFIQRYQALPKSFSQ
jgi:hypothetical protein